MKLFCCPLPRRREALTYSPEMPLAPPSELYDCERRERSSVNIQNTIWFSALFTRLRDDIAAAMGASIYYVRKIIRFLTSSPLVTVTNQQILFPSSAFWGSPHLLRTSYMEAPMLASLLKRRSEGSSLWLCRTERHIIMTPFSHYFCSGFDTQPMQSSVSF